MSLNSDDPKIQVRVDPETKRLYKALCVSEGSTMQDDLNRFIDKRLRHGINRVRE